MPDERTEAGSGKKGEPSQPNNGELSRGNLSTQNPHLVTHTSSMPGQRDSITLDTWKNATPTADVWSAPQVQNGQGRATRRLMEEANNGLAEEFNNEIDSIGNENYSGNKD
ncbi:hypothetical protein F53441_13749 [Fusarium austroafricanum]|uniref:Uncharacterized protein n=1 Tax=Fusarium austroafricanum TaxID=2364996 RepID=A0A8H4JN37_9HYPO|nr:hypothetical protein F53441_13749 [Fusarium austroafricanum]